MIKFFKNIFGYIFFDFANKFIPFLVVPIITFLLSPEEYGFVAVMLVLINLFVIFIGFSGNSYYSIGFYKRTKKFNNNLLAALLEVSLISAGLILSVSLFLGWFFFKSYLPFICCAIFIALAKYNNLLLTTRWQLKQSVVKFGTFLVVQSLLSYSIGLAYIYYFGASGLNYALGITCGWLLSLLFSSVVFRCLGVRAVRLKKVVATNAIKYGGSLVPHALGSIIRNGFDVIIVSFLLGSAGAGIYSVAFQFGSVLTILAIAVNRVYSPLVYQGLSKAGSLLELKKLKTYLTSLYSFIFMVLILTLKPAMNIFIDNSYADASSIAPIFLISSLLQYCYFLLVPYLFYFKYTNLISRITMTAMVVHIIVSIILVSLFGVLGAAMASVISWTIQFALTFYSYKKYIN